MATHNWYKTKKIYINKGLRWDEVGIDSKKLREAIIPLISEDSLFLLAGGLVLLDDMAK